MNRTGNLTPNDLRNQVFQRKMRGYDPLEVGAVLEEVAAQWEQLINDNLHLEQKTASLEEQLKKYTDLEQSLRDALVVARKAAEDTTENAQKEADLNIAEARQKAETIIKEAALKIEQDERHIHDLQVQRGRLKAEMQALLQSYSEQLRRLDDSRPANTAGTTKKIPGQVPQSIPPPERNLPLAQSDIPVAATDHLVGREDAPGDFDAALNKIFGDEPDTPVPPAPKPPTAASDKPGPSSIEEFASPFEEPKPATTDHGAADPEKDSGAEG